MMHKTPAVSNTPHAYNHLCLICHSCGTDYRPQIICRFYV